MPIRMPTLAARGVLVPLLVVLQPVSARAICNLIPPAERFLPSSIGSVSAPIAAPNQKVRIRLTPCDAVPGGFSEVAGDQQVTITFLPPAGPATPVAVPAGSVSVPPESCAGLGGPCTVLEVTIPPTIGTVGAYGLTGPARIDVKIGATLVASIEDLFQPTATGSCAREPERTFGKFTVLPPPNDFAGLADGRTSEVQATLDANGALLLPFDYTGVLPAGIGSPIARLVKGTSSIDAFASSPGQPVVIPCADLLRSFTIDGRPLPPLLRVDESGRVLLGTADGDLGIIRVARAGACGGTPVGPIFDFTDRLVMDKGPILISTAADGLMAESGPSVQLRNLRSSTGTAAFTRNEQVEGVDINGDGDQTDQIVEVVDLRTGTSTLVPVPSVEVRVDGQLLPTLDTSGNSIAFLESEALQTSTTPALGDLNGDGDAFDSVLRVLEVTNGGVVVDRTASLSRALLTADAAPLVNRRALAISDGLVFFRTNESAPIPSETERISLSASGGDADASSKFEYGNAVSRDGERVIFWSGATNIAGASGFRYYAVKSVGGAFQPAEVVGVDSFGVPCDLPSPVDARQASISDDGRLVAFVGRCPSPLLAGEVALPSQDNIYLRDLEAGTTTRVTTGIGGAAPDGPSYVPELSGTGAFLSFYSSASNLVSGDGNAFSDVFLFDSASGQIELVSKSSSGDQANGASSDGSDVSDDGRFVVFGSSATNLDGGPTGAFGSIYLRDRASQTTTRISRCRDGGSPDGGSGLPGISSDGRYVSFYSYASNLLSRDCTSSGDSNGTGDIFVHDRLRDRIERVSTTSADQETETSAPSAVSSTSDDGRYIAFTSASESLVADDTNGEPDAFVHDRLTGATQRVSVSTAGIQGSAGCLPAGPSCVDHVSVSPEGSAVAFDSQFSDLVPGDGQLHFDVFIRRLDPSAPSSFDLNGNGRKTDTILQVFDPSTESLRANARLLAMEVAVAAGRALVLAPNGKTAYLYDGASDQAIDLVVEANRIALSESRAVVTIGGVSRDTLAVWPIPLPNPLPSPVPDTGVAAAGISVVREVVILETSESAVHASAPVAADLNGDGDTEDRVLRLYRSDGSSPALENVGFQVEEVEVDPDPGSGHLVAFRVSEASQGHTDLNGDGDTTDLVMHVYDLTTGGLIPTGQTAILCTIPGCEPGLAYKVRGDTVSFLTRECDQGGPLVSQECPTGGSDLNGNGSPDDVVVQVFNVRTGHGQVFDATDLADRKGPPPLPEKVFGAPILYSSISEAEVDADLNKDGDIEDVVTLIVGDQDDDGVFDDSRASGGDVCSESSDPDQVDSDRDGIGDVCDANSPYCAAFTPPTPPVAPASAASCQRKIANLSFAYWKKRIAAQRSCFKRIAEGKVTGDATTLCRGRFVGGTEVLPSDSRTATALQKSNLAFSKALGRACDQAAISELETCASSSGVPSVAMADRCLRARFGEAANEASQLAYGSLMSQADVRARRCQLAVGDASNEFTSSVLRATNACLNRMLSGALAGDPQQQCLGSSAEVAGILPPLDPKTAERYRKAAEKVAKRLDKSCPDGVGVPPAENALLGSIPTCEAVGLKSEASVGSCLTCSQWQRSMEMIRATFGPT